MCVYIHTYIQMIHLIHAQLALFDNSQIYTNHSYNSKNIHTHICFEHVAKMNIP